MAEGEAMSHTQLGRAGEDAAAAYLKSIGHEILDRNWRCREGEIDLVSRDGSCLVMTEVKTRSSARTGDPLEAITPRKLMRMRALAGMWCAAHPELIGKLRLDAVSVIMRGGEHRIRHLAGIGA